MKQRLHIRILGAVQGVGFRPFIYRLARDLHLTGYVQNSSAGLIIQAEGETATLESFLLLIQKNKPCRAFITSFEYSFHDTAGYTCFEIIESKTEDSISALLIADIALCDDCLRELFDKGNRRYLYPFINCTNCGPRFSIIESLPYDRKNTSMKLFPMCGLCRDEYENPDDRRFHAQPTACPECGPHVELWDKNGAIISKGNQAIQMAAGFIKEGRILAFKGLGGFQLMTDAGSSEAVLLLRKRKQRDERPFALMFPDINQVRQVCTVSQLEEQLLLSPEAPIVLLKKKTASDLKEDIASFTNPSAYETAAPGNPYLGIMLPYTPLHHILMKEFKFPVIATSGNISEEPMCIDEFEALHRLKGIADYFLIHTRPVLRYVDDSITRIIHNRPMLLRRARGYAPLPVLIEQEKEVTVLATGGHLKNSVALNVKGNVFVSQHIGDLSNAVALEGFRSVISDLTNIYKAKPSLTVCDLHPDYSSSQYARNNFQDVIPVQHHIAHIASCIADNQTEGNALGVAWDGTGYGTDGNIWGGEFFLTNGTDYEHFAQLKNFPLPGGEAAIKDPRRSALGILYEIYKNDLWTKGFEILKHFSACELNTLKSMLENTINCPLTSGMGRLFDAAAALTGICLESSYEGQAAMMLEFAACSEVQGSYHFKIERKDKYIIDWHLLFEEMLTDLGHKIEPSVISGRFHNTLIKIIAAVAVLAGANKVLLTGGCFQNKLLLEGAIGKLEENGFTAYWHQRVPPNDGGISLGQMYYALKQGHIKKSMRDGVTG